MVLALLLTQLAWGIDTSSKVENIKIDQPSVVRVYFENKEQLQQLDVLGDIWSINQQQKFATVLINSQKIKEEVDALGMTLYLDTKRHQRYKKAQQRMVQNSGDKNVSGVGIPGFSCYATVEETFQRMDAMVSSYPDLAEAITIGESWEKTMDVNAGHDIRILKITNKNSGGDKPILFLASAIHAREYATAELNTRFAEYLLSQYNHDADVTWILDHHEIHLSLQTNPDGRKKAETGLLWRKNTNQAYCSSTSNSRGADLNRNYSFEWALGSNECDPTFGGDAPESEPEVDAQLFYIRSQFDDNRGLGINDSVDEDTAGIFVDIHSYSELILYPWGFVGADSPNHNQFQALSKRVAWFNDYLPEASSDLYPVTGASIDTTYGELGIASLVFEIGTDFFQECSEFEAKILPDNLAALMYLARVTQAPYKQPLGPDIEKFNVVPNVVTSNMVSQVMGVANDDRYSRNNGVQSSEAVNQVEVFINELPIQASSGQSLVAVDGVFDEEQEAFVGEISANDLSTGKNLIYVQASDAIRAGATFAKFIEVVEPNAVAQLTGVVSDALTGVPVKNALLSINESQVVSSADGSYLQLVHPGQASLTVSAANYETLTLSGVNLVAGEILNQNIQLQPICEFFIDEMEEGSGSWQPETPWAVTAENSVSGLYSWTDSPGGNYSNNNETSLVSPSFDVSVIHKMTLSYMSICDTEAGYDYGFFDVQYDGGSWQNISRCDNQNTWKKESHELNVPDNSQEMRFRFRLKSDNNVTRDGWYIDDVSIKTSGAACHTTVIDDLIFVTGFES